MKKIFILSMILGTALLNSCAYESSQSNSGVMSAFPSIGSDRHWVDQDGNVQMDAPPPGMGIQMKIDAFDVPADTELQGNFYFSLPSDVPFTIGRIEIAMNEGTHHMNCFVTPLQWPIDSGLDRIMAMRKDDGSIENQKIKFQPEWNASIVWNQSDMMVEAQKSYLNWILPKTPDGKQTVVVLPARQRMIIELHYVNKTLADGSQQSTPSRKGKVIINLWKATTSNVVPSSMMVAKKTAIKIQPHSSPTFYKDCRFTPSQLADTIYILGMTGHFHSRGKSFRVDKMRDSVDINGNPTGAVITVQYGIYQNANWSEPPFTSYDPPIMLDRKRGEFIRYTTEYVNNTDYTFNFGPHVATDEHCNLFSWFVPAYNGGQTLYDNVN
jgi:hypothetical protein